MNYFVGFHPKNKVWNDSKNDYEQKMRVKTSFLLLAMLVSSSAIISSTLTSSGVASEKIITEKVWNLFKSTGKLGVAQIQGSKASRLTFT